MRVCNDLAATIIFCPISFSKPFRGNHFPNIYTEIYFDRDRANRFAPSRFFTKKRNEKSIGCSDSRTDSSRCTPKTISASFQSIFSPGQGASELSTRAWWSSVGRRESGKTRRAKEVETGESEERKRRRLRAVFRGRSGTADRTSRYRGRPTERRGCRRMRTKVHLRAVRSGRNRRCYGALLPRATTTTTTTAGTTLVFCPTIHPAGCPDVVADERQRETEGVTYRGRERGCAETRRSGRALSHLCTRTDDRNFASGYAPPRGT